MSAVTETTAELTSPFHQSAALDEAHIGDINGAFGTIRRGDHGPRIGWRARVMTLLAILGPGLIVMVGDNDAGAFSTESKIAPTIASQGSVKLTEQRDRARSTWRMPPLSELPPARLTTLNRVWLIVLRGYLIVAAGLVLVRIVQLATVGA